MAEQPQSATGKFPKSARLIIQADFNVVFQGDNRRVSDRYWTVLAVARPVNPDEVVRSVDEHPSCSRLGLAIAKKRARRAVDRNRLKRIVRESFRLNRQRLGNLDIVVMNRDACVAADNSDLQQSLDRLWSDLLRRVASGAAGGSSRHSQRRGKRPPARGGRTGGQSRKPAATETRRDSQNSAENGKLK